MSKKKGKKKRKKGAWRGPLPAHPRRYVIEITEKAPMYVLASVERFLDDRGEEEGLVGLTLKRIIVDATYRKKRGKKTAAARLATKLP